MTRRTVALNTMTSNHGPLTLQFDELVRKNMEEWKVPGLSIAIVDGNQTWAKVEVSTLQKLFDRSSNTLNRDMGMPLCQTRP